MRFHGMPDHDIQIVGGSTVVKTDLSVHFLAAATVVPRQHIKTPVEECLRHAADVSSGRISLQAMGEDDQL